MSRFRNIDWGRGFAVPLEVVQGEINRLLEEFCRPERAAAPRSAPTAPEPAEWSPPFDLEESAQGLVLRVDLPGVDPAKVDLSITGLELTIRGEKPAEEVQEAQVRVRERPLGAFFRKVTLPETVATERVHAEYKHGVLTVHLPKQEQAQPRTITIQPH
jgi:HSP20 family protein